MKRIALVTGGNRGIGFEICRQLAERGLRVILTSRDEEKGSEAVVKLEEEGLDLLYYQLDVSDPGSIRRVENYVDQELGRLDVLVNNAAVYLDKGVSVFDLPLDHLEETLRVNLLGAFMLCKTFVPMMERNGYGRVVNVSSDAGDIKSMGGRGAAYKISKAALNALTRVVAHEVRHRNVKINAMTPGWVHTRMGGLHAPRSPRQGADTAVWLATLPSNGPTDQYFYEREPRGW